VHTHSRNHKTIMRIDVITLFPEMFDALKASIPGRAQTAGALTLDTYQLRLHALNKHGQVDDSPYGGEAGMVLRPEPLRAALQVVVSRAVDTSKPLASKPHVVYMSAQGALLTQARAAALAEMDHVIIVCGHYKGVDQRFLDAHVDEELSIGDYVLSGGELPAMVLIDSVARLLPGVLGDIDSADTDSHAVPGRLGWPVYTRPQEFEGSVVPEVLTSGHHANIVTWRTIESLRLTQERRPDLLTTHPLTGDELNLLNPPAKAPKRRPKVPETPTPPQDG
jgi:tRNA (guanine37-N1)-methyltransferase